MSDVTRTSKYQELSRIVRELDIDQLSPAAQKKVLEGLLFDRAKNQLQGKISKADFNIQSKIDSWLSDTTNSKYTRRTYLNALDGFLCHLREENIHPLEITYEIAVQYRNQLKDNYAYASVQSKIRSISSFYSHLERCEDIQRNPFKGMKRLKMNQADKVKQIPTPEEVEQLLRFFLDDTIATGTGSHLKRAAAVPTALAVCIMAFRGLRIGAFDTLEVKEGGAFTAFSKGKTITGHLDDGSAGTYDRLRTMGLQPNTPFSTGNTLKNNIERKIPYLFGKNKYSCHSFRHFFAVQQYQADKDIYRLKMLLAHDSISTTERYLSGLGIETK